MAVHKYLSELFQQTLNHQWISDPYAKDPFRRIVDVKNVSSPKFCLEDQIPKSSALF